MRAHISPVVADLLDNNDYHIEFHGYLTNHVKHAIVALAGLDAPDDVIRAYWDTCAPCTPCCSVLDAWRSHAWR
jgi:hypothetical protein